MFNHESLGKLFVRLLAGGMMLFHGVAKVKSGISGIEGLVESHGFPSFLAYGVFVGEVFAPLLIVLGYKARLGALISVVNLVVAILLAHSDKLFKLGEHGELEPELALLYLLGSLAVLFLGSGKLSLSRGAGDCD
jgi:putative oxidoreductase